MEERPERKTLESLRYFVHDLERSTHFYLNRFGFELTHESRDAEVHERTFRAGGCTVVCAEPLGPGDAQRFLDRHPDGIGEVVFRVASARETLSRLEARGATPVDDVRFGRDGRPSAAITTPFGRCTFRFVEGVDPVGTAEPTDSSPFLGVDHLTANLETLAPASLWLEHVLGFEDFWRVEFQTDGAERAQGTGLRSRVLVDRGSGLKIALNEPRRPNFHASQIETYVDDNHGPGFQHVALAVRGLPDLVAALRERGVAFLETNAAYYDALPERLRARGLAGLEEPIELLREQNLLVDGEGEGRYLLQIFLRDSASLYGEKEAGPFFYELIERKGDPGFGEGNFRALFESIERDRVPSEAAG